MQKIVIIDYGINNIKSIYSAIKLQHNNVIVSNDSSDLKSADKIVLPGTGAFIVGMRKLSELNLIESIKEHAIKKPLLGICLGMQLLFDESHEFGNTKGLSILQGAVMKITENKDIMLPFIGWSTLYLKGKGKLFNGLESSKEMTYFVHSFKCEPEDESMITAITKYKNIEICASIEKDNIFGCQFHPEKSSEIGLKILQNFIEL